MNKKKLLPAAAKYFYFLIDEDIQEDECFCRLAVQAWNCSRLAIPVDAIDCRYCEFRESCNHILKTTDEEIEGWKRNA